MTRHEFITRCRHMLFGWGFVGLIYSLGAAGPAPSRVLHETALDRLVPFEPPGIWVYLSFFVLVGGSFLALPLARLPRFTRSFQIAALTSGVVFWLWPTQLATLPVIAGEGLSVEVLRLLDRFDTGRNCLPSLHAALTWLCVREWLDARRPWRTAGAIGWGLAMLHAILQTRRHLSLDIAAGWAVGLMAGWLAGKMRADVNEAGAPEAWRAEEVSR